MKALLLTACFTAATVFAQADEPMPSLTGEAKARIQNLEQRLEDWDVDGAKEELAALSGLASPDGTQVLYFTGRVAFEEGHYEAAIKALEAAGVADKPGSWLRLARETYAVVKGHQRLEGEHFVIETPPGKDSVLAPWALQALESARSALEKDLGYAPPGKVRIEFVSSAAELSKVSTLTREAIRTTGTIAICKFNKLMVTSPKAVVRGYDWLDTVAHEYVHLVVSKKSRNTVPIWMHEGLAKYLESRWRGPAGGAMTPSSLALLGRRVRANTLVTFQQMHPSMALLPTAEDAATAFAEVFFAIKLIDTQYGPGALNRLLTVMASGQSDKAAVERITGKRWVDFERNWMALLKNQPYPKDLLPKSSREKKELADAPATKPKKNQREVSFGDFVEIAEPEARRAAHLGELMRERRRMGAAADFYGRAYTVAKDKYESLSNKLALTLLELKRLDEAQTILEKSLTVHPGSAATNVHLARVLLRKKAWAPLKQALEEALAVNPFDPEVQLGLYVAATKLGHTALQNRAQLAFSTLTGVTANQVPVVAARMAEDDTLAGLALDGSDAGP